MNDSSFFYQALIYLSAAVIVVPLMKRLGLGSVLGYLVAGALIGPQVLGFVGREGQDVLHFAEFGVVMMLFVIGLELEPSRLWRLRSAILGLGGLQILATTLVVGLAAMVLGQSWPAALALGMILSLSSTAIGLQSLEEKGLLKQPAGQSSFAVLLFQDIAVIPMLAIFPLLVIAAGAGVPGATHSSESQTWVASLDPWLQTLVVLGAVAGIIVAGRYLVRPLFRFIASTKMHELFTATALLLVIAIAVLMAQVGLSPALGTFVAGVVLANSEYRHELVSDLEPFKGLLLGLFFLSVGASINFLLIVQEPLTILLLVVALMIVKMLVLFTLGRLYRLTRDQNLVFTVALAQVGEFAFVLFSLARQTGLLDPETVGRMTAVVALSMALTPLLMLVNEKLLLPLWGKTRTTERAADTVDVANLVIIAGFDRFGITIGRLLKANDVGTTVLDNDARRVEILRKLGLRVYYGDASRLELLEAAGAGSAQLILITFDEPEKSLNLVHLVKKHYPHLKILVRAQDRPDAYELIRQGESHVYRDTLDTALRMGVEAMKLVGVRAHRAHRAAQTFLKYDEKKLRELALIHNDKGAYMTAAREAIADLESLIQADGRTPDLETDAGWDPNSLREEVQARFRS